MYNPCSDTVSVADGVEHFCMRLESIDFCLLDGSLLKIISIRYVSIFDCNLLSLEVLKDKGAEIILKEDCCRV